MSKRKPPKPVHPVTEAKVNGHQTTSAQDSLMKLGRLAPRFDSRTLQLSDFVSLARLPAPPETNDWAAKTLRWPMLANNRLGDCALASCGHCEVGQTSNIGTPFVPTDQQIIKAYSDVTGYSPNRPGSDRGAVMLDVMKYWRRVGIAGKKIVAFAQVDVRNHELFCAAHWLFGGVMLGIRLPLSAQGQDIWRAPGRYHKWGPYTPGSWGGHAVWNGRYAPTDLTLATWGRLQRMTWAFLDTYVDEAYVVLSRDTWIMQSGQSPSGFALQDLISRMNEVTGGHFSLSA